MLNYNKIERELGNILGHSGGITSFSLGFNKELLSLDWVDDYIEDKKLQDEIDTLEKSIMETRTNKISKDELRAWLEDAMQKYRKFQLEQLQILMKELQNRELPFFSFADKIGAHKILGGDIHPYVFSLTNKEKDAIFAGLEGGMTVQEIDSTIKENQARIDQLKAVRKEKFSPRSRWIYKDTGEALPYPNGCRWTIYVKLWKLVAGRFEGVVDNIGYKVTSDKMLTAYIKLGLDKQRKRQPAMTSFE